MLLPQILLYEHDGALTRHLRPLAQARRWSFRRLRSHAACLAALRRGTPTVLVIKLGRDLVEELGLLDRACWLCPTTAAVVVSDVADPVLSGLAWDLGAAFVCWPPLVRVLLSDVVAGLMESVIGAGPQAIARTTKGARPALQPKPER